MSKFPALRLAAVSDTSPPRRSLTTVTLTEVDPSDALHLFAQFAVMLRENYAITVGGVVHLLPANRGKHADV